MSMKKNSKIGVGIVGTGGWSNTHIMACKAHPDIELVGLCDIKQEAMQLVSKTHNLDLPGFTDYHDLLKMDKLDAVIIATSNDAHAPISIAAAQAGKHVLCQKPMALNLVEAKAMTAAVKKAGVCNMVCYTKRFFAHTLFLHDYLQSAKLGRVYHVRATYFQRWLLHPDIPRVWRLNRKLTGSGSLGDLGAHVIDLAQYFVGDDITRVTGIMKTFVTRRPSLTDSKKKEVVDVDDATVCAVEFKHGAIGVIQSSRNATGHPETWLVEIDAEKGAVEIGTTNNGFVFKMRSISFGEDPRKINDTGWEVPQVPETYSRNEHLNQVNHFIECIQTGKPASPSFADGLKTERVIDAIIRSSQNGMNTTCEHRSAKIK